MTHNELVRKLEEVVDHVKTLEKLLTVTVESHVKLMVRSAIQRLGFGPSTPSPPMEKIEAVVAEVVDDLKPFAAVGFDSQELLELAYFETERLLTHR